MALPPRPILLSLVCVAVLAPAAAAQPPLVPSGSFDTAFSMLNWSLIAPPDAEVGWSGVVDFDDAPDSGSLRILTSNGSVVASGRSACRLARPGTTFEFRAWYFSPSGSTGGTNSARLEFLENCSEGGLHVLFSSNVFSSAVDAWTLLEGSDVTPQGAGGVRVVVGATRSQAVALHAVYFDEVALPEPEIGASAAIAALSLLALRRRYT